MKQLSLATATTAVLLGSQIVKADEVDQVDDSSATTSAEVTTVTTPISEQVKTAKEAAEVAQEAVTAQNQNVTKANQVAQATQAEEIATAKELAKAKAAAEAATPEGLATATEAVKQAESNVVDATEKRSEADSVAQEAQNTANQAKEKAATAQTNAQEAQVIAETAKNKRDELRSDKDKSEAEAREAVEQANTDVMAKQAVVDVATQDLEDAKEADADLAQRVEAAEEDVASTTEVKEQAQADKDAAKLEADNAVAKAEQAQADADAVQPSVTFNVNLPQRVKDAFKVFGVKGQKWNTKTLQQIVSDYEDQLQPGSINDPDAFGYSRQIFGYTIKPDKTKVDVTNLTAEDLAAYREAYFGAINALREAFGIKPADVSSVMNQVTDIKASKYQQKADENGGYWYNHDTQIMRDAEKAVKPDFPFSENMGSHWLIANKSKYITREELQESAINLVKSYVLWDHESGFGHALNVLRSDVLGTSLYHVIDDGEYKLIDVMAGGYYHYERIIDPETWESTIDYNTLRPASQRIKDGVIQPKSGEEYKQKLVEATSAKIASKAAQAKLATAEQVLTDAEQAVNDAQAKLDELKATKTQTPAAQEALDNANAQLSQAIAKKEAAEEILRNLEATDAEKEAAIQAATEAYEASAEKAAAALAEAKLKEVEAQAARAHADEVKAKSDEAKAHLEEAEAQLEAAKANKVALENAEKNLKSVQAKYDAAKTASDKADEAYNKEVAKLTELKEIADKAAKRYNDLKDLYDLSQTYNVTVLPSGGILAVPKTAPTTAELPVLTLPVKPVDKPQIPNVQPNKNGGTTQQGFISSSKGGKKSSTGTLSSLASTGKSNLDSNKDAGIVVTPTGVTYSRVARANAQALPATGDDTNVFASLVGAITLGLGLSLADKRRKKG